MIHANPGEQGATAGKGPDMDCYEVKSCDYEGVGWYGGEDFLLLSTVSMLLRGETNR